MKDVAKRKNIRGYSKLRKEDLKTLLRNRLPWDVFEREITGRGDDFSRWLLDEDNPELSQKPLHQHNMFLLHQEEKA